MPPETPCGRCGVTHVEMYMTSVPSCVNREACALRVELRELRVQHVVLRDAAEDFVRHITEADEVPVPDRVWIALAQHALKVPWPTDTRYIVERIEVAARIELRGLRAAMLAAIVQLENNCPNTQALAILREAVKKS
jgi:hypothetical protein